MRSTTYKGYTVFEDGRVIGLKGTFLKPGIASNGYYTIVVCTTEKNKTELIHRMVAACFLDNPDGKRTVNHINGNKLDNRVENLEWATDQENIAHAFKNGLNDKTRKSVRERMQKRVVDTVTGNEYSSAVSASAALGINPNSLRTMLCGFRVNKTNLKYAEQ